MYEALLKSTAEYQKIAESLHTPGPAALFGLPPAGRALLYAALQKDLDRVVCIVTDLFNRECFLSLYRFIPCSINVNDSS